MFRLFFWFFLLGASLLIVEWTPALQTSAKLMISVGQSDWYAWQPYFWFFVAVLLVLMELYVWVRSMVFGIFLIPTRWVSQYGRREKAKDRQQQDRGFHSLVNQDWEQALDLYQSFPKKRVNDEVCLGAYYAALNLGQFELAKEWLSRINFPESTSWNKELLSIDLLWKSGHQETAFFQVMELFQKQKNAVVAQRVLLYGVASKQLKRLDECIDDVIRALKSRFSNQPYLHKAAAAYLHGVLGQSKRFYNVYRALPKLVKDAAAVDAVYSLYLRHDKGADAFLKYLENRLDQNLSPEYLEAYAMNIEDPARQLEKAVSWQESNEPLVDVLIARCNMKQGVIPAAGHYLLKAWEKSGSWTYVNELYDFLLQSDHADLIPQYSKKIREIRESSASV